MCALAGKRKSREEIDANLPSRSDSLPRRIVAYAIAAGAVGLTVCAAASSSEPPPDTIVFTPAHLFMGGIGTTHLNIDLNHDGIPDLTLEMTNHRTENTSSAFAAAGGAFWENPVNGNSAKPRPLPKGVLIGGSNSFGESKYRLAWGDSVNHSGHGGYYTGGPWANSAPNQYLGVRFLINGEVHYGWARMSVVAFPFEVSATITGYAYNTAPNQPIRAGEGAERKKAAVPMPGSLGVLALGSVGLSLWRRNEQENEQPLSPSDHP